MRLTYGCVLMAVTGKDLLIVFLSSSSCLFWQLRGKRASVYWKEKKAELPSGTCSLHNARGGCHKRSSEGIDSPVACVTVAGGQERSMSPSVVELHTLLSSHHQAGNLCRNCISLRSWGFTVDIWQLATTQLYCLQRAANCQFCQCH